MSVESLEIINLRRVVERQNYILKDVLDELRKFNINFEKFIEGDEYEKNRNKK